MARWRWRDAMVAMGDSVRRRAKSQKSQCRGTGGARERELESTVSIGGFFEIFVIPAPIWNRAAER
jgi:hypothetical protein